MVENHSQDMVVDHQEVELQVLERGRMDTAMEDTALGDNLVDKHVADNHLLQQDNFGDFEGMTLEEVVP